MKTLARIVVLAATIVFGIASRASAQDTVTLLAGAREERAVDLESMRAAIGRELGIEVRLERDARAGHAPRAPRLTLTVPSARRAALTLVRADGTRMRRSADLPDERDERTATLAILATNMLRDESSELLALLRRAPEAGEASAGGEADVSAQASAESDASGEADASAQAEAEPAAVAEEDATAEADADATAEADADAGSIAEPDSPAAPALLRTSTPTTESSSTAPLEPPAAPRDPWLRLGLEAHASSVPIRTGHELTLLGGFHAAWIALPFLAIGFRDIGGGVLTDTGIAHFEMSPFVEGRWLPIPEIALYGQLGTGVQLIARNGTNDMEGAAAPFALIGARFHLVREFSIGIETALHGVATDGFLTHLHGLPQGAMLWSGGLSLLFHIS